MGATKLRIVAGKGGVGRTTVSAGLARQAAAEGQRVLAVDAAPGQGLALALGADDAIPGRPTPATASDQVGPPITILVADTGSALDEYVRLNLRSPISPRALGPVARIFEYVATAAPAVREVLIIGKIGEEVRSGQWDLVVVDAPATGHLIELLSAPRELAPLVGGGPLARDTAWIDDLLADPDTTATIAVTTPEELPVTETLELVDRLRASTPVTLASVVVNRWPPPVSSEGRAEAARLMADDTTSPPLRAAVGAAVARADRAQEAVQRLGPIGVPVVTVDEHPDPVAAATIVPR